MSHRSEELAILKVEYFCRSGTGGTRLQLGKGTTIDVRFRLSDTVSSFIEHLGHSFNGLQSTSNGKELYLVVKNGKHIQLDTKKQDSLETCGVKNNDYLFLRGYKPLSRIKYSLEVDLAGLQLDEENSKISIKVINTTTLWALRHKIQNRTGIHESEILLFHKGRKVSSLKTVDFYHISKELLRVKRQVKVYDECAIRNDAPVCADGSLTSSYHGELPYP